MIKLMIGVLTAFSLAIANLMQGYVDRANAVAGSIDPKYANTLSVETRPSVYLEASRRVIEKAEVHAPGLAADVERLYKEYEGRISAVELREQLELLEQQAEINPVIATANQYIEDTSIYFDELVIGLALDLVLVDIKSFSNDRWNEAQRLWDELSAGINET